MRVIHVLRKPCSESTVAANVLRYGTGAMNIDATRVTMSEKDRETIKNMGGFGSEGWLNTTSPSYNTNNPKNPLVRTQAQAHTGGRWPANLILQHLPGCVRTGTRLVRTGTAYQDNMTQKGMVYAGGWNPKGRSGLAGYADEDGMETVAAWSCEAGCPMVALDGQSGERPSTMAGRLPPDSVVENPGRCKPGMFAGIGGGVGSVYADTGGASRFFKQFGGGEP